MSLGKINGKEKTDPGEGTGSSCGIIIIIIIWVVICIVGRSRKSSSSERRMRNECIPNHEGLTHQKEFQQLIIGFHLEMEGLTFMQTPSLLNSFPFNGVMKQVSENDSL